MTAVRLLLVASVVALSALAGHAAPSPVTALAYRGDGALLAAGIHGQVILIDPKSGDEVGLLNGIPGRVTGLAFSKDGLLAVACGEPGKTGLIRLYDAGPGRPPRSEAVAEFAAHKDAIYGLAFRPDGKELATAGYDRVIKLWHVGTTTPRLTLTDHSDAVYSVAYSPDGKLLASAAADRAVKVWDPATGKRLYTLGDPTDWVYAVAWSADGKTLAAAGVDRSIRLWAVTADAGRLVRSVFAHNQGVTQLAAGPGGLLVSAGEDRQVKIWDAARLTETRVLPVQPSDVLAVALRPDGQQIAVGRFDGTAAFYDPATGQPGTTFLPVKPKPPDLTAVVPDFAPRGTTVQLKLRGSRLDRATGITASDSTIQARLLPASATGEREAELDIPPSATIGPVRLTLTSDAGNSSAVRFVVDRFPAVHERGSTDSAHAAMPITLPATVIGTVDRAGDTDYYRFEAKAGQHVGIQVITTAAGSKLNAVLTLTDDQGQVLAESDSGLLGCVIPRDGAIVVGIRDREYRGGPDFTYRLYVGPVPVITGVFPLGVQRGKETSVHVDGVNLGPPHGLTTTVRVPADAAIGSSMAVPLPSTASGEKPLGRAAVVVGEFPAVVAAPDITTDLRAVPGTADGILARPGEAQTVRFPAKKGSRLIIETHAARLGSPLDPAVEILDSAGKPVPRATLRCVAKTFLTFRDHDDAKPGLRLDAWNELAVNDYLYVGTELMRIKALPGHPDADCDFVQVGGRRVSFLDTTPTHHAHNTPMYKVEVHPPGATFPPNGMPVFTLYYRNDDGGPGHGKDSRLFFDPPADGLYQVRIADARGAGGSAFAYRLTVRPPRPGFSVAVTPQTPNVWRGSAVPLTLTATRLDGYDGPIDVRFEGLAAGLTAPATRIEEGQTTTAVALEAAADAPPPAGQKPRLIAKAIIDGKDVIHEAEFGAPKVIDGGDILTTTSTTAVSIVPGRESRFVVTIERRNGFAGRVPLDVRGLPHGVTVQNIGLNGILVTEKETRREVVLRAEPWVQPAEVPIVVLARSERKGTEHAAKTVILKVAVE